MNFTRAVACALCVMPLGATAVPHMDDYVEGVAIETSSQQPIVELALPDSVYQATVSDGLSDVRVFNADGVPVPHAYCAARAPEATISQESLPVYPLQEVPNTTSDGTRVEVQTQTGARISVEGGEHQTATAQTAAFVIDARNVSDELRAMQFDWSSSDGASELRVSVQASEDLDRWRTIVPTSTLLRAQGGNGELRRHRIAIPQAKYQYLRVQRVDRGPPLVLDSVIAERVTPPVVVEPAWFAAQLVESKDPHSLSFDAGRLAPTRYARLLLPTDNSSLQITLESRRDQKAAWRTQWTGEVYAVVKDGERRVSPPAEFPSTTDRYWRVRLMNTDESFYQPPVLELGYRPAQLRFLAQGSGPFTLAYGSRRAEAAKPRACDSLLANLNKDELEANIAEGYPGAIRKLGGDAALRPLPKQTPLRQVVLWGVLVVGAAVLVGMALSLMKRVRPTGE